MAARGLSCTVASTMYTPSARTHLVALTFWPSSLVSFHSGLKFVLLFEMLLLFSCLVFLGKDASAAFDVVRHSDNACEMMRQYCVGSFVDVKPSSNVTHFPFHLFRNFDLGFSRRRSLCSIRCTAVRCRLSWIRSVRWDFFWDCCRVWRRRALHLRATNRNTATGSTATSLLEVCR